MNLKLLDLYQNCVTTFHLSQEHFARSIAPVTLNKTFHNLSYKLKLTSYYAALFRYIYSVTAFNRIVPMRRIAGTDAITLIVSIRAAQSSAFTLS
jgi:hypothetical protein